MKKSLTRLVAMAICAAGLTPLPALSAPPPGPPGVAYEIYYYSDLDFQTEVGHYIHYCDDHWAGTGHPDIYSLEYSYDC